MFCKEFSRGKCKKVSLMNKVNFKYFDAPVHYTNEVHPTIIQSVPYHIRLSQSFNAKINA